MVCEKEAPHRCLCGTRENKMYRQIHADSNAFVKLRGRTMAEKPTWPTDAGWIYPPSLFWRMQVWKDRPKTRGEHWFTGHFGTSAEESIARGESLRLKPLAFTAEGLLPACCPALMHWAARNSCATIEYFLGVSQVTSQSCQVWKSGIWLQVLLAALQ